MKVVQPSDIDRLRVNLRGSLLEPTDVGYNIARRVDSFNPETDRHPRLIVRCQDAEDVVLGTKFAREHAMELAVRSGGHDVLGASVCEDGMLIDLSRMNRVAVDARNHRACVSGGALAQDMNAACHPHGLLPIVGVNPTVGVAGLTLGGGFGLFLGRYGASCDNLLAADVVDADGQRIRASPQDDAELFWALRGGGGNFGIVTSLEYQLHPLDKVLGGLIAFRTDIAPFLEFYEATMQDAPDELVAEVVIFGLVKPIVLVIVCWCGDISTGQQVLQPLRSYTRALVDAIDVVSYAELNERIGFRYLMKRLGLGVFKDAAKTDQQIEPQYGQWRGGSMCGVTAHAARAFADAASQGTETWTIGLSHRLHGAACRVSAHDSPLPRPAGTLSYLFGATWRDPARGQAAMEWVTASMAALQPFSSAATYVNFLSSDEPAAIKASYGHCYERLAELKRKYDPNNVLRGNRNIQPATDCNLNPRK